jgi:ATP-dependent Clp protease adaptor protein ClpS
MRGIVVGIAMADSPPRTDGDVLEKRKTELKEPEQFKVILLNDDYTPMDFVVAILETVFLRPPAEAYRTMMQVHRQGRGLAGVYTHDVAETKAATVVELAREEGYPLQTSVEKA